MTQATSVYGSRLARLNPRLNIGSIAREGMENTFCTHAISGVINETK